MYGFRQLSNCCFRNVFVCKKLHVFLREWLNDLGNTADLCAVEMTKTGAFDIVIDGKADILVIF